MVIHGRQTVVVVVIVTLVGLTLVGYMMSRLLKQENQADTILVTDSHDGFDARFLLRCLFTGRNGRQRMKQEAQEHEQRMETKAAMLELAFSIRPMLANQEITNLQRLAEEYARYNPGETLVQILIPAPGVSPRRNYFALESWSPGDPPGTPLLWAYFGVGNEFVEYLTISGSNATLSSNAFARLSSSLSGRIRRYPIPAAGRAEPGELKQ